jgi:Fur family ferric uptake transcriptional regulator
MSEGKTKFQSTLKSNGYSLTSQRQLIFDILLEQESISMNDLVKKAAGKLDRVSVYRTLNLFEKLGISQRIKIGWKYKLELSDNFRDHHHHLICLNCNRVIAINEASMENFIDKIAGQYKFKSIKHEIEIQGLCPSCQK